MQAPIKVLVVQAIRDEEAAVWVATSDPVPGLATEAEGMDTLVDFGANGESDIFQRYSPTITPPAPRPPSVFSVRSGA